MPLVSEAVRPRMSAFHESIATEAHLFSPNVAVTVVLPDGTSAVWLPVTITPSEGGRPSIYDLATGVRTLIGLFITGTKVIAQYVTRLNDLDEYSVSNESGGKVLYQGTGKLTQVNTDLGYGLIEYHGEAGSPPFIHPDTVSVWVGWSCIKVDVN